MIHPLWILPLFSIPFVFIFRILRREHLERKKMFEEIRKRKVIVKNEKIGWKKIVTGSCLDCNWQGNMEDAETDPCGDYDEFKGVNIPTKICPKCEGVVEMD